VRGRIGRRALEQHHRQITVQALERELRQPRGIKATQLPLARGKQDHDPLRSQAAGGEHQSIRRGHVEPLGVVDHTQQRPAVGCRRQQGQHARRDQEAIRALGRGEAKSRRNSIALKLGQPCQLVLDRSNEAMETREIKLGFGLDAGHRQDRHPICPPPRIVQQGALSHAGIAAENDTAALAALSGVDQPVDRGTFAVPADQTSRGV